MSTSSEDYPSNRELLEKVLAKLEDKSDLVTEVAALRKEVNELRAQLLVHQMSAHTNPLPPAPTPYWDQIRWISTPTEIF